MTAVTYEFSRQDPEDASKKIVQSITLDRLLVGLRTEPAEEGKRSQAETFASYAVQRGFTTEDEIFARYDWLNAKPENARNLITTWRNEVDAQRAQKAYATMKAKGSIMSVPAMDLAKILMPRLKAADFGPMAARLGAILSVDEDDEGPQGAELNKAITRARYLLGETDRRPSTPAPQQSQSPLPPAEMTEIGDPTVVLNATEGEGEEPF